MKRVLTAGLTALATLIALVAFLPSQSATAADDGVPTTWKSVSARGNTTCAIDSSDALWCWGYNNYGQVGNGSTDDVLSPVRIGSATWRSVATSDYTTCGIRTDRTAYCWGYNPEGQTGTGTTDPVVTPTRVDRNASWAKISPGYYSSCGTSTNGSLYCWGYNGDGGVGDGTTTDRLSPVRVGSDQTWSGVYAGYYHVCARATDKTLSCWGYGGYGALGNGTTDDALVPTAVPGSWAQVSATAYSSCGVTLDGISKCWGYGGDGQLGDGTTDNQVSPTPLKVGSKSFSSVLSGDYLSCGVTSAQAKVRCFGTNSDHEFGNGTTDDSLTPTDAAGGLTNWAKVSVGDYGACGIRASGALYCWGYNGDGQLGVGTTDPYDHRVLVGRTPAAAPSPTASPSANRKAAHPHGPSLLH